MKEEALEYSGDKKISNTCSGKAQLELLRFIFKLNVLILHVNDEQLPPSERPYFKRLLKILKLNPFLSY